MIRAARAHCQNRTCTTPQGCLSNPSRAPLGSQWNAHCRRDKRASRKRAVRELTCGRTTFMFSAYDHDVNACLLREDAIAFAITKERLTMPQATAGPGRSCSTSYIL